MKTSMIIPLAAIVAIGSASCHSLKVKFQPFDGDDCQGQILRSEQKMKHDKCYNFDDFASYQAYPYHEEHLDADKQICDVWIFPTKGCTGQNTTYGDLRSHAGVCDNANFTADQTNHQGRSAKFSCKPISTPMATTSMSTFLTLLPFTSTKVWTPLSASAASTSTVTEVETVSFTPSSTPPAAVATVKSTTTVTPDDVTTVTSTGTVWMASPFSSAGGTVTTTVTTHTVEEITMTVPAKRTAAAEAEAESC